MGKNNSSIHKTVLNSMHPKHTWVFLKGSLLGTKYPPILRVYCKGMQKVEIKN
jgi:hypothetical protein